MEFSAKYQSFDRINAFQSIEEFTNSWMDYAKTNYCRRIYNNTVSTCQEYASIQQYQSKKQENPIYALFLKCYNKLYSRVRKGKIEKDSELFSQLYGLRDSYMKKYHDAPSDDLVKEFEELTKKL